MLHISKVQISNFLGEADLDWNLNQVNVLVGKNGSGKSTLLKLIQSTIEHDLVEESWLCNTCSIHFNENDNLEAKSYFAGMEESPFHKLNLDDADVISQITQKLELSHPFLSSKSSNLIESFVLEQDRKKLAKEILATIIKETKNSPDFKVGPFSIEKNRKLDKVFHTKYPESFKRQNPELFYTTDNKVYKLSINIDFFATTNMTANSINKVNLSDGKTSTILDMEIQKGLSTISNSDNIDFLKDKLLSSLNSFFHETEKMVLFKDKLEIRKKTGEFLNIKDLSSGEKQIIYIFLKVVNACNKNSIFLMDEPEISLHMSWQEKLINEILNVNPNQQIIIVTHSPAIVMNGWMDSFKDIDDILVKHG